MSEDRTEVDEAKRERHRIAAMRKAIRAATEVFVDVYSSDDAHSIRVPKSTALWLVAQSGMGFAVGLGDGGRTVDVVPSGVYPDHGEPVFPHAATAAEPALGLG